MTVVHGTTGARSVEGDIAGRATENGILLFGPGLLIQLGRGRSNHAKGEGAKSVFHSISATTGSNNGDPHTRAERVCENFLF